MREKKTHHQFACGAIKQLSLGRWKFFMHIKHNSCAQPQSFRKASEPYSNSFETLCRCSTARLFSAFPFLSLPAAKWQNDTIHCVTTCKITLPPERACGPFPQIKFGLIWENISDIVLTLAKLSKSAVPSQHMLVRLRHRPPNADKCITLLSMKTAAPALIVKW